MPQHCQYFCSYILNLDSLVAPKMSILLVRKKCYICALRWTAYFTFSGNLFLISLQEMACILTAAGL